MNHAAYAYSLPDLKYLGGTNVGADPDWITFSSDSKTVYVACSDANSVSAIDVASIKEVARIPVGEAPKRNTTVTLR
jgi:YVTN family beta-propeller protein